MQRLAQWTRRAVVLPIRLYQGTLSRITPATCRFRPTCSQYTLEAILNRGLWVGGLHAFWRILRCNPFSAGGWDPPPGSPEHQGCTSETEEDWKESGADCHSPVTALKSTAPRR